VAHDEISCDALERKAASEEEPTARCQASLQAARCLLVSTCSTALSNELGAGSDPDKSLRESASRALKLLDTAVAELEKAHLKDESAAGVQECIELLRAFATLFRALGSVPTTGPAHDELLSACGGLAGYFEDPRTGISEAAKLWQGVAYRRAGKPERALQVLRPALSVPASRRLGFWARLERCRALADRGDFAAALALGLRLSARVDAWFEEEDQTTRRQAADSVRWIRVELLRAWSRRLGEEGQKERAKDAQEDADHLLGAETWPVSADRWLSLGPPVADLPDCHIEPTSRPASTP
jgi:tetratricopeptide (TPR) repeat protein